MSVQQYTFPITKLVVGEEAYLQLPQILEELECKKILIVTDKVLFDIGVTSTVTSTLSQFDIEVYAEIQGDPTVSAVENGLKIMKEMGAQCIVAIGGGSSIDAAKAISILAKNDIPILQTEGIDKFTEEPVPIVAIPTTAGTGSEVSPAAVITNEEENRKFTIRSWRIAPKVAILDPIMLETLPEKIAAATSMDAFCHNIEYFLAKSASSLSEGVNLQAIRMINQNIRDFVADRTNKIAAKEMLIASMIGEISFALLRLSINHAIAHPLGAHFKIHHGLACAIMLPYSLRYNFEYCIDKLPLVAQAMDIDISGLDKRQASERAIEEIEKLIDDLNIPKGLKEFGIKETDIPILAKDAMKSTQLVVNPRPVSQEDIENILLEAISK